MEKEMRGRLYFVLSALGSVVVPVGLALILGFRPERAILLGGGAVLLILVCTKPWWFWEHFEIRDLRELFGDRAIIVLYVLLAALFLWTAHLVR